MPHCSSSLSHRCSMFFLNFHFLSCISYLCAKCQSHFFLVSSLCSLSGIFFFPLYDIIPPILLLDASPIAPLSHFPFLLYLRFFILRILSLSHISFPIHLSSFYYPVLLYTLANGTIILLFHLFIISPVISKYTTYPAFPFLSTQSSSPISTHIIIPLISTHHPLSLQHLYYSRLPVSSIHTSTQ